MCKTFWTPPTFHSNHAHLVLMHCGKFLGFSNKETNSKSTITDSVATYSWNFIHLIVRPITAWTGITLAVRAMPPFLAGLQGGGGCAPGAPLWFLYLCLPFFNMHSWYVRFWGWHKVHCVNLIYGQIIKIQCNLDYPDLVYMEPRLSRLAWD